MRSDEKILSEITEMLNLHSEMDTSDVVAEVREGLVVLRGTVDSSFTKLTTEYLVGSLAGVVDVENYLSISKDKESSVERSMSGQDNLILKDESQPG